MYPDRNPFPPHATMSLDAMTGYHLGDIPTATTRVPLQRLRSILRRYLTENSAVTGRAVAIHGEHGTGKTHAVLVALSDTQDTIDSKPPIVLYVRADGPDPLVLYRKLMSRWTAAELAELAELAFAGYAADEFTASREPSDCGTSVPQQLRDDPQLVRKAMQDNDLSYTDVVNRQDDDIRRIQGRYGVFERVLRCLAKPALRSAAHRWLLAADVSPDELKRLGVAGAIEEPAEIRVAIHILAALAKRAGRPLTLAIDQLEAFFKTAEVANAGFVRGVVEDIVEEQGLIIVAMGEQVWHQLPQDLRQRFGPTEIHMPELSLSEAADVLSAYLAPWQPKTGQRSTFPFRPRAVRQLLVESGGNIRRFIQASHVVFEHSEHEIDATKVKDALNTAGGERAPSEEAVRQTVERALLRSNWDLRVGHAFDGHRIDYAVLSGDRIVLAVQISQAVFGKDEATKAVQQIELIQALRQQHQPVVLLIVVGYSSPDVRDKLREAGQVVVADGPGFASALEAALDDAVPELHAPSSPALDEQLAQLRDEVLKLSKRRDTEEQLVSARLAQSNVDRETQDWREQIRRFRMLWLQERLKIESDIAERRSQQRHDEVAEIVTLHGEYTQRRWRRFRDTALLYGILLFFAVTAGLLTLGLNVSSSLSTNTIFLLAMGEAAVAAIFSIWFRRSGNRVSSVERSQNLEDLKRVARQESGPDLRSADPLRRYQAILSDDHLALAPPDLYMMALHEPSAILRRALLTAAIAEDPEALVRSLDSGADSADLSSGVEVSRKIENVWETLPPELRVVVLLRRDQRNDDREHPRELKQMSWIERFVAGRMEIHNAFNTDNDIDLAKALQYTSERNIRRAAAILSPLDREGLGSHYWLSSIDTITDMYLFFRKALFFLAGGVESPPVSTHA